MKDRFDTLLPFYVNGTLSEADRAWVEAYLQENPKAAAELRWYESLRHKLLEDTPPISSEVGLERTLARIRAESATTLSPARTVKRPVTPVSSAKPASPAAAAGADGPPAGGRAQPVSAAGRLRSWLAGLIPQPVLRPAFAGACAVVLAQAVVIGSLMQRDPGAEIRALPPGGAVADAGPYLKLNFKPDARETDIRLLLVEVHGSLAAGPGQLGDYYVRVPTAQIAASSERVKASTIVDAVAIVDALPPRER